MELGWPCWQRPVPQPEGSYCHSDAGCLKPLKEAASSDLNQRLTARMLLPEVKLKVVPPIPLDAVVLVFMFLEFC